jgi:hypothetical protein
MVIPLMCAMCIAAIFFAGAIFRENPQASMVIVALAAGFLGIFYASIADHVVGDE